MATPTNTQFAVAVHVLTYLAGIEVARPVSSGELAASVNASPVYVRRVLTPLRESGLMTSSPGAHGGWVLRRAPETISLAEVWRLVQGDDPMLGLHGPNPSCATGTRVQRALTRIEREVAGAVDAQLARVSIADVLDDATVAGWN
ncbi:Rrf2 family transcriptional regulator [Mycolicibacterium mengxianglii]|uniref:Rrf2 family transcriptional regulator n=1 Tax=Mycolicibacterium mengxianglii TaxID=2736649 RepID=UPI0018D12A1E|nr:Rrf2 family transcriptional regulator [Mycolicibacterium mengxianglii]